MKIKAVRVREVGTFRDPVALEGLSGSLDVLAGPNELGKSTLFRGLEAAFLDQYTTKSDKISKWMVPDTGGAPIIEVDFDTGGAAYRLRKRFFSAAKASLTGLDDGTVSRGADAEAQLAELLVKAGGVDRLGLMWVRQTASLDPFEVNGGTRAGLKGLIERELAAVTGGEQAHAVQTLIQQRLDALVTGAQRRPKGAYKEAVEMRAQLAAERGVLTEKAAHGSTGFDRLGVLRESHATLIGAGGQQTRTDRIAMARNVLETARAAADKRRAGEEQWKRLDQNSVLAAAALADFGRRSQDAAGLAKAIAALTEHQAGAHVLCDEVNEAVSNGARALASLEADAHALQAQLEIARRFADYDALATRLAEAEALALRLTGLQQSLAANAATPDLLRQAETEARAIETLNAQLTAGSTRVSITYEPGAEGRITRDGAPLHEGAHILAEQLLVLTIPGLGRIAITPGVAEGWGVTASKIEHHRRVLAELLVKVSADTLSTLRDRAVERTEHAAEHGRAAARLQGLCPEGLETLRGRLAVHVGALQGATPHPVFRPTGEGQGEGLISGQSNNAAAIEAALQAAVARHKSASTDHRAAQSAAQQHSLALAKLDAELAALGQRNAATLAKLPPEPDRDAHRAKLDAAHSVAADRAREAVLTLKALRDVEPAPEHLRAHEAELAAAIAADAEVTAALTAQGREMATIEAVLQRDALDGIAERLAECEGELNAANRRLALLTREIAALELLKTQFRLAGQETRERYLAPVLAHLAPYLSAVIPGAELQLGEAFAATRLSRNGRHEAIERLSHGTREQVALLVRLGLASVLAGTGEPLPLILDDALVYADDERIAASFSALRLAAERHQVIVFTCRSKAFETLGGTRLALTPWQGFSE